MPERKSILILSDGDFELIALEAPLVLAGYDVHCRQNVNEAVELCLSGDGHKRKIDLLIIEAASRNQYRDLRHILDIEYLLLVNESDTCTDLYCFKEKLACLCSPSALLAAVRDLFDSTSQMKKGHESTCQNRQFIGIKKNEDKSFSLTEFYLFEDWVADSSRLQAKRSMR